MKGFKNVNAFVDGEIKKLNIGIVDDRITYIGTDNVIDDEFEVLDDQIVVPGFIDEHIHGADGADAMDGTTTDIGKIANALVKEGTTGFLATTMTQSPENIAKALKSVNDYKQLKLDSGAEVLGVHLEGPFISHKHIGAQPKEYIATPLVETFKNYQEISGNNIKLVSLAPEVEGCLDLIKYLNDTGVIASAGHTDAGYQDIENAIAVGLTNVTHTFNAQKPLHHREIGTVGSAMLFDELNCEAICDTIHLSIPAIKLLIKNKPKNKITLITDSMRAKYLKDGLSELGGQTVIVKNGEARLVDGTLAGSILKMNVAIKNLVEKCNVKLEDAITYATINPAINLKIDKDYGSITIGKKANFTILNKEFDVCQTIRNGKIVYKA